jgi:hypothetical protein
VIEQIGWKIHAADQVQLRQFFLHAGEAGPSRGGTPRSVRCKTESGIMPNGPIPVIPNANSSTRERPIALALSG